MKFQENQIQIIFWIDGGDKKHCAVYFLGVMQTKQRIFHFSKTILASESEGNFQENKIQNRNLSHEMRITMINELSLRKIKSLIWLLIEFFLKLLPLLVFLSNRSKKLLNHIDFNLFHYTRYYLWQKSIWIKRS